MGMSIDEYKKIALSQRDKNTKNALRQLQGKVNRQLGKSFEEQIEIICEQYKLNKIAIIEKTPEPMKILKHIENGRFETVFEKFAQPDFKGCLQNGKAVVFDAKFTESDKITYQVLSEHQRNVLLTYDSFGALAFVLVGFIDGSMYSIDIKTWVNMKEIFGTKHIKQCDLENFKALKNKNGIIDFLSIF